MHICKKIKDLILADYVDGEADPVVRDQIDSHLHLCSDCRRFAQEAQTRLITPFKAATRENVPPEVWLTIKARITEEKDTVATTSFWERFTRAWMLPQFAPVLGSLVMLVLVGSVFLVQHQIRQVKEQEQGEYLLSLFSVTDSPLEAENNGAQSPIEEYFL